MTAVEWLEIEIKKFNTVITKEYLLLLTKKAIEMEKQQIIDAYVDGFKECEKIYVYNGFRPNCPISDDLEDLKKKYTPKQLQKMWDECYPKSSEISGKVIITGTPK